MTEKVLIVFLTDREKWESTIKDLLRGEVDFLKTITEDAPEVSSLLCISQPRKIKHRKTFHGKGLNWMVFNFLNPEIPKSMDEIKRYLVANEYSSESCSPTVSILEICGLVRKLTEDKVLRCNVPYDEKKIQQYIHARDKKRNEKREKRQTNSTGA